MKDLHFNMWKSCEVASVNSYSPTRLVCDVILLTDTKGDNRAKRSNSERGFIAH